MKATEVQKDTLLRLSEVVRLIEAHGEDRDPLVHVTYVAGGTGSTADSWPSPGEAGFLVQVGVIVPEHVNVLGINPS